MEMGADRQDNAPQAGGGPFYYEEPLVAMQAADTLHQQQRCSERRPKHLALST